jgi:hypothetical protein
MTTRPRDVTGHEAPNLEGWLEGGCTCRYVRYRVDSKPLFVHCCHCRWCQRETGTSYAINALIEADRVEILQGRVKRTDTPTMSGKGQQISRCPRCEVALWSRYAFGQLGDVVLFLRVGTLDDPGALPPDIHIYTASKLPWVLLDPRVPAVPEYYRASDHWPAASLERHAALTAAQSANN